MQENVTENNKEKQSSGVWELIKYALIAVVIVVPFRIFIAQPYIVNGSSMDPTFKDGDYLIVDQLSKRFETPERGAVIIMRYPKDTSKFFIKRLIAYPGETVEIKNGAVYVKNTDNPLGLKIAEPYVVYNKDEDYSVTLESDQYFVMGDNRAASSDSRIWGPLPGEDIVGRPLIRLLPLNKMGIWPGMN